MEREHRSLSTLILASPYSQDWITIYTHLLLGLVDASGTWTSKSLAYFEAQGINIAKAKRSSKGIRRRTGALLGKLV